MDEHETVGTFMFLLVIVFSLCMFMRACGKEVGREEMRSETIKREYASYRCNKETGTCEFKWNDDK